MEITKDVRNLIISQVDDVLNDHTRIIQYIEYYFASDLGFMIEENMGFEGLITHVDYDFDEVDYELDIDPGIEPEMIADEMIDSDILNIDDAEDINQIEINDEDIIDAITDHMEFLNLSIIINNDPEEWNNTHFDEDWVEKVITDEGISKPEIMHLLEMEPQLITEELKEASSHIDDSIDIYNTPYKISNIEFENPGLIASTLTENIRTKNILDYIGSDTFHRDLIENGLVLFDVDFYDEDDEHISLKDITNELEHGFDLDEFEEFLRQNEPEFIVEEVNDALANEGFEKTYYKTLGELNDDGIEFQLAHPLISFGALAEFLVDTNAFDNGVHAYIQSGNIYRDIYDNGFLRNVKTQIISELDDVPFTLDTFKDELEGDYDENEMRDFIIENDMSGMLDSKIEDEIRDEGILPEDIDTKMLDYDVINVRLTQSLDNFAETHYDYATTYHTIDRYLDERFYDDLVLDGFVDFDVTIANLEDAMYED